MSRSRRRLGTPTSGQRILRALPGVLLLPFVWTCGGIDPTEPPVIRYGVDVCDRCRMIVSDARYAAARWLPEEAGFARYDDIGCLVADLPPAPDRRPHGTWVHDHENDTWIDARTATYLRAEGLETPMDSHLAAFATPRSAERFAAELGGAEILEWRELLAPGISRSTPDPG